MKYLIAVLALAFCASAQAGTFQVGIADPGPDPISSSDVSALGLSVERRSVIWRGQASFDGRLNWTPGLREIVGISGGAPVPAGISPTTDAQRATYCDFVGSVLDRYPQIHDVLVWNEANLSAFWGVGAHNYALLLNACAPTIRAHGARAFASMSPATPQGAEALASAIAAVNPHSVDAWDQHSYDAANGGYLRDVILSIRAALGWRVPVLVGESGGTTDSSAAWQMMKAYCAGAFGWLNFKLRNDGDWQPTWLEDVIGTPLPAYWQVATEQQRTAAGGVDCSQPTTTVPPQSWIPDEALAERLGETGGWTRDAYLR